MKSAFGGRKRRPTNIDQLLRDDLLFGKSTKSIGARVEEIKRNQNKGTEERRIVFEEAKQELRANELIDFNRVIVLAGMDAFVGTSSGVLKGLTLSKSSFVNLRVANQQTTTAENADQPVESDRSLQAISAISFTGHDQMEVLVGRRNGQVDMFNSVTEQFSSLFTVPSVSTDNGQAEIRGIHTVGSDRILTAQRSGALGIWDGSGQRLSAEDWTAGEQLLTMRTGPTASSAADQQQDGVGPEVFATGGKENPLKLWDLATQKCTFTAKNVRPDKLELRVPVWVTCCRFLDNTGKCIATSTGKGQLRVYDTRAQRRPVVEEAWADKGQEEEPIQALSTCSREWNVLAGNTRGELGLFDMRSNAKSRLASKYKGFAGAIRCIDASPNRPEILSCGIDRFAIVHDLNSRAVLRKIYCKVQLNCCVLCENNALQQPKQQKQRRPKSAGNVED